jgi:hypothetical protein
MATVLLRDPVVTSIDVFLRFTIEGPGIKIYTNPSWKPAPLSIQTGIPVLIPSTTIAECLRPQNIVVEGMSPQELYRGGKLPEGYYQFKVEVFEYNRGVPISNVGRAGVWLLLNEPPRIVFPANNQKVNATNPQFINFSWVPGGIASPLSAPKTMYEFTLVELLGDVDPNIAITTAPDALKFTRTLQQTSLLYGPGEPPLIPGKRYTFRVRAYNTEGYEIFKNNGYSEVRVFQFGDACLPPTMFTLKDETQNSFAIEVVADPGSTAWQARFREGGNEGTQWSELKTETTNSKTVKGLKASTEYQVQLKSLCGTVSSDYTAPQTITTRQKVNTQRSCDNSVSPFVVQQAQPLKQLKPNNVFLAAQIPIRVTEVTSQRNGKFTGKGVASLPLFNAGLAVTFTDISINELMQLTAGNVVVERSNVNITLFGDTEPVPGGGNGGGSNPDSTGTSQWPEFTDTLTVDSDIDSVVVVNDSTVWVYTAGGTGPIVTNLGGNDCLLIVPADGNMDRAVVVYNGAAQPYRVGSGSDTTSAQPLKGFRAWFTPAMGSQFGYDSLRIKEYSDLYNDLFIDSTLYKLPWKALAAGIPEPVEMHVRRGADSLAYSTLKVLADGKTLTPTTGANTALQTYNLIGTRPGDEYPVLAKYPKDDEEAYAGGLWTATYQKKGFTLYVVPLPGTRLTEGTVGLLQNYLNQIYSQAVVSWNVQAISGFPGVDLGDNGLDHADNELLSAYNPEMNRVISAFKDWHGKLSPDAAYLFLVPKADGGLQGYMPFNRQFGFVVVPVDGAGNVDAATLARTAAHELGHGIFSLRHTFSTKNFVTLPQGTTDNLMDYAGTQATKLYKYQWDYIHNPQTILFAWAEEEEEGAMGGSWTILDKKHTLLFNHVYSNNKEGNLKYNEKIAKALAENPKEETIELEYEEKEEKEWIYQWKLRTASSDQILEKIIKKIQNTEKGKKIEKMTLKAKGIYIGKYKLNDVEYPIAIYSEKDIIDNIIKVQVSEVSELEKEENRKHLKAEETFIKYLVIAFYEEGNSEPVLMVQIEKFDISKSQNTKEKWLKYMKVLIDEPNKEEIYLSDVPWISQYDNYFKNETCYPDDACCNKAANKILEDYNTSTQRGNQVIIAQSSSSDCSSITATSNYQQGIDIIDKSLKEHKLPIMVGVHHPNFDKIENVWIDKCSGNTPSITNHYIVIVGTGFDKTKNKKYYLFYEVGTNWPDKGKSKENKLYIESNNLIVGETKYVDKTGYYTITEVRKNNGKTY